MKWTLLVSTILAANVAFAGAKAEIADAQKFQQDLLKVPTNAAARARLLELVAQQVKAKKLMPLSRKDFTLVLNMGLGWNSKLGPDTQPYVHMFVKDMRSMDVPTVFLDKDAYGTIPDNAKAIEPLFQKQLGGQRPIMILTLCKGAPEMITAIKDLVGPTLNADREQTEGPRLVAYVNMSGMLTGTFYSDIFGDLLTLKMAGYLMSKSSSLDVKLNGKGFLAAPSMETGVVESIVNEGLKEMPSDMYYLNIIGAPTDREFENNNSALGPFFKLNDKLHLFRKANDGFLDARKIAFPAWVSEHRATVGLDATHVISDGSFGPYKMKDEFTRRAIYRAMIQFAIEKGIWK